VRADKVSGHARTSSPEFRTDNTPPLWGVRPVSGSAIHRTHAFTSRPSVSSTYAAVNPTMIFPVRVDEAVFRSSASATVWAAAIVAVLEASETSALSAATRFCVSIRSVAASIVLMDLCAASNSRLISGVMLSIVTGRNAHVEALTLKATNGGVAGAAGDALLNRSVADSLNVYGPEFATCPYAVPGLKADGFRPDLRLLDAPAALEQCGPLRFRLGVEALAVSIHGRPVQLTINVDPELEPVAADLARNGYGRALSLQEPPQHAFTDGCGCSVGAAEPSRITVGIVAPCRAFWQSPRSNTPSASGRRADAALQHRLIPQATGVPPHRTSQQSCHLPGDGRLTHRRPRVGSWTHH
jgi:hypothetical protein